MSDSVSSITLIAGLGAINEMEDPAEGIDNPFYRICAFLKNYPSVFSKAYFWLIRQILYYFDHSVEKVIKMMPEIERNILANNSVAFDQLLIGIKEGLRQGSLGMHIDHRLIWQLPWGFTLQDVKVPKIKIYYGKNDSHIPISHSKFLCKQLPHAKCFEEEKGHYSLIVEKLHDLNNIILKERNQNM